MSVKLYPPIINGVLPAFYLEYDVGGNIKKGGKITVPFSMNGAVSETQFKGFSLRLRTASSGSYVLPPLFSNNYSVTDGEVSFFLSATHANALTEGQYYKLQIAYCGSSTSDEAGGDIGYYSTVGVAKCVSKPEVTIRNLVYENINAFNNEYFGFYDLSECKDRTEKVYSYEFKIYDEQENVYYSSGEKLHQAYYDTDYTSSIDRIVINDFASTDIVYSIEYTVTTLNGLVLSSPKYKISSQYLVAPNGDIKILPEADWENGVITVHFQGETDPNHSYYYVLNDNVLNNLEVDDEGNPLKDSSGNTMATATAEALKYQKDNDKLVFLRNNSLYRKIDPTHNSWFYVYLRNVPGGLTAINGKYYYNYDVEYMNNIPQEYLDSIESYEKIIPGKDVLQSLTYGYVKSNFIDLSKKTVIDTSEHEKKYYGSYLLSRASDEDNYTTWFNIARLKLDDQIPSNYTIRDVTIEHGRKYKYALQQYNIWGLYSARIVSDVFEASFEDAFLFDGEKSLRIRYNPTVDSFKTTILEQKTDTIGGRYPFITRNGATYYKEFPLGGLLAQEIDEWHQFVDPNWDHAHRHATGSPTRYDSTRDQHYLTDSAENALWNSHDFSDTTIALERNFKLKVLEWLNDGKPKLFKSPYEGNYIVRLMNISLTPVKELGRMLHSFTSQAYEIAECTYDNLVAYGFIKTNIPSDLIGLWSTYNLHEMERDKEGNVIIKFENGVQSFTVQDLMPGDIIYLKFADSDDELPIMIGITGSYSYEGISSNLMEIRIPQPEDHELTGVINCFYTGMRVTDFDAITNMMLKTVISQQYVGTSPWMQKLKHFPWDPNDTATRDIINDAQYNELQNYNFRTYLDQTVNPLGEHSYSPTDNFVKLVRSFDPGELLDRINLTIHQGQKYKTEILNMEMIRFRERPLIPVFCINNLTGGNIYVPGEYSDLLTEKINSTNSPTLLCATTPYGYPHPIEELAEYEMLDPFCIYQVFQYNATLDNWQPIVGPQFNSYYDPYYRTWLDEDYDPTVKMNYNWVAVAYLETKLVGYCTTANLNFLKYNYSNLQGLYWANDDENSRFNIPDDMMEELSEELDEENGYTIPIYSYTDASQELVNNNRIHQENKKKYERGEYIDRALNEREMFDHILYLTYYDESTTINHYHYINNKGAKEFIESNKYDLFEKVNDMYFAIGVNNIEPNTIYWYKEYDIKLNMTTEKSIQYDNVDLMNSYHIGNGVVAELTFQLRIIDYYTEIYDEDVRRAKEAYLNAKAFYSELMKNYNIIAKANLERNINLGFKELYYKMLNGNALGKSVNDSDKESIENALSQPKSKAELQLMSLYNITIINQANNIDIVKLLLQYKNSFTEEERPEAFDAIEMYHYFQEEVTKIIDEYYVIDSREFNNSDNMFYLISNYKYTYLTIPDDGWVTYHFTSGINGSTYYYKVYKDAYIQEYLNRPENSTAILEVDNLKVVLNIENNSFYVATKEEIISNADTVYELEVVDTPATLTYLDLLSDEELIALKDTTTYLYNNPSIMIENDRIIGYCSIADLEKCMEIYTVDAKEGNSIFYMIGPNFQNETVGFFINSIALNEIELVNNSDNLHPCVIYQVDKLLYEEFEILTILNKQRLDGAVKKYESISKEVNDLKSKINEIQTTVNNLKVAYIDVYNKLFNDENSEILRYNQSVYDDWAGRVLYEALNPNLHTYSNRPAEDNLAYFRSAMNVETGMSDTILKEQLIKLFTESNNNADVELIDNVDTVNIMLFAAGQLYENISGKLPEVQRYHQMIHDNTGDEQLDEILTERIIQSCGQIVLEFYAMRDAIAQVIDTYNDEAFTDQEKEVYIEDLRDCINKYNILYPQLIDSETYTFKEDYKNIQFYLDTLAASYLELEVAESNKTMSSSSNTDFGSNTASIQNLSLISCYYEDYEYLKTNKESNLTQKSYRVNSNETLVLKRVAKNAVSYGTNSNTPIPEPPVIPWFDPFANDDPNNIFRDTVMGWSNMEHNQAATFKELDVYHYRNFDNIAELDLAAGENVFKYFIFNPLGNVKDPYFGINSNKTNIELFRELPTATLKNNVLRLHQILAQSMVRILEKLDGEYSVPQPPNGRKTWCDQIRDTYIYDCRYLYATFHPSANEEEIIVPNIDLYTERQKIIEPYQDPSSGEMKYSSLATLQQKVQEAISYLLIKREPEYLTEHLPVNINTYVFSVGIDDKMPEEYHIQYEEVNVEYDEDNNIYPKVVAINSAELNGLDMEYYYNWYQAIMIKDSDLEAITKLNDTNTDIVESGIYYEYVKVYLDEIDRLNNILTEAELLQRLYQKQVQVYTAKYEKYNSDYETNQAIYSSYSGTEAFSYYNLLNSDTIDDSVKQQAVSRYKKNAQEAWWKFLNLLDARYSAEKERGMYV